MLTKNVMRYSMWVLSMVIVICVIITVISAGQFPDQFDNIRPATLIALSAMMFVGGVTMGIFFGMNSERRITSMLEHMCEELNIKPP